MAKIAILGFGTVGSGVYEVLCRNAAGVSRRAGEPVEVKYILDPKDFSDHQCSREKSFGLAGSTTTGMGYFGLPHIHRRSRSSRMRSGIRIGSYR